jgi:hypothetical protein
VNLKQNKKAPNSRRNLDIAIGKLANENINALQVRSVIANTVVGQMLPDGIVKGGSALKFRFGSLTTRFTKDVDTARAEDLDKYLEDLSEALRQGWNGFTGRVVQKRPARPTGVPGEYIMQPFEIKLSYLSSPWVTVSLEIGHDEIGDTDDPDYFISDDIVEIFTELGFPKPDPIALLPIPHQISQKLHALSSPGSRRAHDLIDLQLIFKYEEVDLPKTKVACIRLFASRRQQEWPIFVVLGTDWESLYADQLGNFGLIDTAKEAVKWINGIIEDINSSL